MSNQEDLAAEASNKQADNKWKKFCAIDTRQIEKIPLSEIMHPHFQIVTRKYIYLKINVSIHLYAVSYWFESNLLLRRVASEQSASMVSLNYLKRYHFETKPTVFESLHLPKDCLLSKLVYFYYFLFFYKISTQYILVCS